MLNILLKPIRFLLRKPYWFLRFRLPTLIEEKTGVPYLKIWKHKYFCLTEKSKRRAVMTLYRLYHGYDFDWENPQLFNEKLAVRKLNPDPRFSQLADKFTVREYVREKIGEQYLVPLFFEGMNFSVTNFERLSTPCVIKTAHGSGTNILVFDKPKMNAKNVVKQIKHFQKLQFGYREMEIFYNKIPPRVIVEKMLLDENGKIPNDYKFHCFRKTDGHAEIIVQVDFDRHVNHRRNLYDTQWNYIPMAYGYPGDASQQIPRPEKLEEMLNVAEKLAEGFSYVRVDLYYVKEHIYFGELTFTHGSATEKFTPPEYNRIWGEMWGEE
ncbi:MAG: ATP-grasp fold amidoligase family protein [Planctomycetia bacterium]|nr:ATP-grasp fold amidoligase family protein [Planctomycetia bacterium]